MLIHKKNIIINCLLLKNIMSKYENIKFLKNTFVKEILTHYYSDCLKDEFIYESPIISLLNHFNVFLKIITKIYKLNFFLFYCPFEY